MLLNPLLYEKLESSILIPPPSSDLEEIKLKQDIGIEEMQGYYYSLPAILRKYANNPKAILYLASLI